MVTEAQKLRILAVWKDVENGVAKNKQAKAEMIILYNEIYKANYKTTTNCASCLNTCWSGIKAIMLEL